MSLFKFIAWFTVGIVGNFFLVSTIKSPFMIGFMNGLLLGVLGAKD